ncbi:heterokaryon incompatibility protein-domain-containing protein [Nemania serpens]|nr:heterokaryon incompatibility protein-domain-containing protein [Nemania serpens]
MVQYSRLSLQLKELRLLYIHPGEPRDPIKCTLRTFPLDYAPKYEALSYVWGDPNVKKSISIDGSPFQVTVNLKDALARFRQRHKHRILWADAICIAQHDLREKSEQVPHMNRVYSYANAVIIWLGPSNSSIDNAVLWYNSACNEGKVGSAAGLDDAPSCETVPAVTSQGDLFLLDAFEGICAISELSYWSRKWTYQEYILARNEPLCFCGQLPPFQISTLLSPFKKTFTNHFSIDNLPEDTEFWKKFAPLSVRIVNTKPKIEIISRLGETGANNYPLATHLFGTADRECYMPQDRFFALYGLTPRIQDIYPLDYGKEATDIAREITSYIVNYEYIGSFWMMFGIRDDTLHNESQPSWVPDFSRAAPNAPYMHCIKNGLHGLDSQSYRRQDVAPPRIMTDNATLHIWAKRFDVCAFPIRRFSCVLSEALAEIVQLVGRAKLLSDSLLSNGLFPASLFSKNSAKMAQLWFSHAYYEGIPEYTPNQLVETFGLMYAEATSQESIEMTSSQSTCRALIVAATRYLLGKTMFLTGSRHIGIGPGDVQGGDIITMSPHILGPLVLRKQTPTSSAQQGQYRIVGPAILDVILKNSKINEGLLAESQRQDLEEFLIW